MKLLLSKKNSTDVKKKQFWLKKIIVQLLKIIVILVLRILIEFNQKTKVRINLSQKAWLYVIYTKNHFILLLFDIK